MKMKKGRVILLSIVLLATLAGSIGLMVGPDRADRLRGESIDGANGRYQPLATDNSRVVATYKGGQEITEGQVNLFMNILVAESGNPIKAAEQLRTRIDANQITALASQLSAGKYLVARMNKKELAKHKQKASDEAAKKYKIISEHYAKLKIETGFTQEDLEESILCNLVLYAHLENKVAGEQYSHVKVQHILVKATAPEQIDPNSNKSGLTDGEAKERAEAALEEILAGKDFAKMALAYSDCPSAQQGGLIAGCPELFLPEFRDACNKLPLGKVSKELVHTQYGYHIVRVLERGKKRVKNAPAEIKALKLREVLKRFLESKELDFNSRLAS